jgi:hypothetical protein
VLKKYVTPPNWCMTTPDSTFRSPSRNTDRVPRSNDANENRRLLLAIESTQKASTCQSHVFGEVYDADKPAPASSPATFSLTANLPLPIDSTTPHPIAKAFVWKTWGGRSPGGYLTISRVFANMHVKTSGGQELNVFWFAFALRLMNRPEELGICRFVAEFGRKCPGPPISGGDNLAPERAIRGSIV